MGLHEISHSFLEGGQVLVNKKAITPTQLSYVSDLANCLNVKSTQLNENSDYIQQEFQKAVAYDSIGNHEGIGIAIAEIANKICEKNIILQWL